MFKHMLLGLGAASLLVVVTAMPVQATNVAAAYPENKLGHDIPTELIVTRGDLEWVWASRCAGRHDSSSLEQSCGSDGLDGLYADDPDPLVYLHSGFNFATNDQWTASFATRTDLLNAFEPNRFDDVPALCAAEYFSYAYNDCHPNDVFAGAIWHAPSSLPWSLLADENLSNDSGSETFLVRQRVNGSVPEPSSLLLLGAGLLGLAAWRWKHSA